MRGADDAVVNKFYNDIISDGLNREYMKETPSFKR